MATSPSLTAAGLIVLTLEQSRANIVEALQASPHWGDQVSYGADSPGGELIDVFCGQLQEVYDLLQALHAAMDPAEAEGVQQDNACEFVGIRREAATHSIGTVTLGGTAGTVVATGKRVRVGSDGPLVETTEDGTIAGGGTDVSAQAVDAGAIDVGAGAVDTIIDAVSGWDTVTNATAFATGTEIETDATLRARRARSFSVSGSGTYYAIRARLEALDIVTAAAVLVNVSDETDSDGLPPHTFNPIVYPSGLDAKTIAEALWSTCGIPAGIASHGTETYYVNDSKGSQQEVHWSWATDLEVYIEFTLSKTSSYPSTGDTLVKAAAVAYGNALGLGNDVLIAGLEGSIIAAVPGIADVSTRIKVGSGGTWQTVSLTVNPDQIAQFATARVTII